MPDRIYVTYSPTTAPESYHTAIHYERTDEKGNVVQHRIIEAKPERLDQLSTLDKAIGVIEEALRGDNGASRFGNIKAETGNPSSEDQPPFPYEDIAKGDDLSANLARMQLFALGVNRAGFAYRGDHQNSNSFASAVLQAGGLPSATGVARDPSGPAGELLDFFAPGLNEPLRPPIGPNPDFPPDLAPGVGRNEKWKSSERPSVNSPASGAFDVSADPSDGLAAQESYRRLTRRTGGPPSVFEKRAPAVPYVQDTFDGRRFGNWTTSLAGSAPVSPAAPIGASLNGPDVPDGDDWLARLFKLALKPSL